MMALSGGQTKPQGVVAGKMDPDCTSSRYFIAFFPSVSVKAQIQVVGLLSKKWPPYFNP